MRRERRPLPVRLAARREVLATLAAFLFAGPGLALADPVGTVTKLPLPRFASLKTDRVNLREGPSKDHATKWVYQRAGLPVEITAEFEIWRRVRDAEGVEGRIDNPHVGPAGLAFQRAPQRTGHAHHVAEGGKDHIRIGGQIEAVVDATHRQYAHRAAGTMDQFNIRRQ